MQINELKIGRAYLIKMPTGYVSDFLVIAKTDDEEYVKLYDIAKGRFMWYSQGELAAAEILGEVIWNEKVLELHKELFGERRRVNERMGRSRTLPKVWSANVFAACMDGRDTATSV